MRAATGRHLRLRQCFWLGFDTQTLFASTRTPKSASRRDEAQADQMKREQTNHIRFIMEDLLPPIIRDTALFRFVASLVWGRHISTLSDFRQAAPFVTTAEYDALYRSHPRVHEGTDNCLACLERIQAGP